MRAAAAVKVLTSCAGSASGPPIWCASDEILRVTRRLKYIHSIPLAAAALGSCAGQVPVQAA